ncbi:MAG: hypothetical protein WAM69_05260 [Candidatus Sulfotelmatobacter sp.]
MARTFQYRKALVFVMVTALWLCLGTNATAGGVAPLDATAGTALDQGFLGLYNLDFSGAQKDFSDWEAQHPDDPVGPVSQAAGFLFSEFNRLGVLESQFYESDEAFGARSKLTPDPVVRGSFQAAVDRAQVLAHARLAKDSKDQDALFAMTLASGLQADYAALIEKRDLASLHYTKEASTWAQQLLAVCDNCSDVLVATGFSKYIIGSMAAPVRWLLRIGGLPGDKQAGIADLQLTAQHGHYLKPFARILLAIAYVRAKDKHRALQLLTGLRTQFPANTLFPREIARLQTGH